MFTNSQYLHLLNFLNVNEPSCQLTEKQTYVCLTYHYVLYTSLIKATILIKTSVIQVFGYFLLEAILTAYTANDKLFSSCVTISVFSFDVVRCPCSHFDIMPPKSVL